MSNILLDTHVLLWLLSGSDKIGKKSSIIISEAVQAEKLYISAISIWEIAMLAEKGRIVLKQPLHHWYKDVLSLGIKEIPVGGDVAMESVQLQDFHADPADRMIVATAIGKGFTLVTGYSKILKWHGSLERCNVEE